MKFALWALFIILLIWLLRGKKTVSGKPAQSGSARTKGVESIVRCVHCGVHVPASESIITPAGMVFCSEEHRLRHAT
jgi:uncharacterized protein